MSIKDEYHIFKANYYGLARKDGNEARLIQITEIIDDKQQEPLFMAYPSRHFGDFSAKENFIGQAATERDALDDCINKIDGIIWDELFE